jgi:hypothetical protein
MRWQPNRLTPAQWRHVLGTLRCSAGAAGCDTERWTLRRITLVVRRQCGVAYHVHSLSALLRAPGCGLKRPASRAREYDEALAEAWLRRDRARVRTALAADFAAGWLPGCAAELNPEELGNQWFKRDLLNRPAASAEEPAGPAHGSGRTWASASMASWTTSRRFRASPL